MRSPSRRRRGSLSPRCICTAAAALRGCWRRSSSRLAAPALVRARCSDTLAFFKLRRDTHYLSSADRRAFFAYRVEAGTMLISGDPVGPEEALPELVREGCEYAERCGLKVGVVGASN